MTGRFLGHAQLIASASTLSGAPPLSPSRWGLKARLAAAAAAGFTSVGIAWQEYRAWRDAGIPAAQMARHAADVGVQVIELEFLHGWASDAPDIRRRCTQAEEVVWAMADTFGSRHVNVGDIGMGPPPGSFEALTDRFAMLCDRAARHDLTVGYEWIPGTILVDVDGAVRLVNDAERSNAGVVLDLVHLVRRYGGGAAAVARTVPPERVVAVQIADGAKSQVGLFASDQTEAPVPIGHAGTPLPRRLPGQGAFDLVAVLRALDEVSVDAPIGVEVMSPEMRAMPIQTAARAAYDAAITVLLLAGRGAAG